MQTFPNIHVKYANSCIYSCVVQIFMLKWRLLFQNSTPFCAKCHLCKFCQIYMPNMQTLSNIHAKYANFSKYASQICKLVKYTCTNGQICIFGMHIWKSLHIWHVYLEKFAQMTLLYKRALSFEKVMKFYQD